MLQAGVRLVLGDRLHVDSARRDGEVVRRVERRLPTDLEKHDQFIIITWGFD